MTLDRDDIAAIAAEVARLLGPEITAAITGQGRVTVSSPAPPPDVSPEAAEENSIRAIQAEGRYILETQGLPAYKEFWKQQGKQRKPRMKKAA